MKRVGIADLKAHLSGHLREVKRGEVLLVMERGTPVARIIPTADRSSGLAFRPAARPLAESRRIVGKLGPLEPSVDSLSLLLEDRKR
jgi:prevent-host-death family protein